MALGSTLPPCPLTSVAEAIYINAYHLSDYNQNSGRILDKFYLYIVLPDSHKLGGSLQDEGGLVNDAPSLFSLPRAAAVILIAS